jgi:fructose/tagatose bisphosphate aldolase
MADQLQLPAGLRTALAVADGRVRVLDERALRGAALDALVHDAVFARGQAQAVACWLIWESALALGIVPSSINDLYMARGRGETPTNFTVPAINLRMIAYDSARAVFRAAHKLDAGAMLFEIARSEIGYTEQRPAEYVAVVLAAAIREGHRGPVYIQGDHFQINAKKYAADPQKEYNAVQDLALEALQAGFFNIDIDTSTLVDLARPTIAEQQELNYRLCAQLTTFIRQHQPQGVTVSVGGEIGEVGGKNSTAAELRAFIDGYRAALAGMGAGLTGISKISVQTGTSHGGVVLPDGTIADVAVDFGVLAELSRVAREAYGLAGAVQHGASTLPESAFGKFTEATACEVHLATGFQNLVYDLLPDGLRGEIYGWLQVNAADERKAKDTDEQFLYKTRKKAIGPFKSQTWGLGADFRALAGEKLEEKFAFLFERLNIGGTHALAVKHTRSVECHRTLADFGGAEKEAEDVSGLAD